MTPSILEVHDSQTHLNLKFSSHIFFMINLEYQTSQSILV